MFEEFERWPIQRGPKDHIVTLRKEEVEESGAAWTTGEEAMKSLIQFLRSNQILVSTGPEEDVFSTNRHEHNTTLIPRKYFPDLIQDDHVEEEDKEDDDDMENW